MLRAEEAPGSRRGPSRGRRSDTTPEGERWVVVRTTEGEQRARATLTRKAEHTRDEWEKALWHLSAQRFACEPDAQAALTKHLTKCPEWLTVSAQVVAHPTHTRPGRPRKDAAPDGIVGRSRRASPSTQRRWSARRGAKPASWSPPTCSTRNSSPTSS